MGSRLRARVERALAAAKLPFRPPGSMTPDPGLHDCEVLCGYIDSNAGDPEGHPESLKAIEWLVRLASLASLGVEAPGWVTAGASEANLLALYWAREKGYRKLVAFDTAHYSVFKAARILEMRVVKLSSINGYAADLESLRRAVDDVSIIVATVGTTETGYVDPVVEIAEIAKEKGAVVHVDAAFAGIVARHTSEKARFKLEWPVAFMAVDAHKIPDAPAPAGVLLAYDREALDELFFEAPYTPTGRQFGVLGTRPGGPVAAAALKLASLLSDDGSSFWLARRLMDRLSKWIALLEQEGYKPVHEPETPVACLIGGRDPSRLFAAGGTKPYRCPRFGGVRLVVRSSHLSRSYESQFRTHFYSLS